MIKHTPLHRAVFGTLLTLAGSAHAINNGIVPANGAILNPLNGQEVRAWQFVGQAACSAIQIHARWVLEAAHCGSSTHPFTNALTSQGIAIAECWYHPLWDTPNHGIGTKADMHLCRLASRIESSTPIPPLVAAPADLQLPTEPFSRIANSQTRDLPRPVLAKFGYIVAHGKGGSKHATVTDFAGTPDNANPAKGLDPLSFPDAVPGDSGGGVYWLSPSTSEPALLGVMTTRNLPVRGASLLTEDTIEWIRATLASHGDNDLRIIGTAQHFSGPSGNAVQELGQQPRLRSVNNSRNQFALSWAAPSNSAPISHYDVTLGTGTGTQELSSSLAEGLGNSLTLNAVSAGVHTVCVRARGASGSALPAYMGAVRYNATPPSAELNTPNCKTFDTATPAPGTASGLTVTRTTIGSLVKLAFDWQISAPGAVVYRLSQVLSYPPGLSRSTTLEATTHAHSVTVAKGTQVCLTVQPLNDIGVTTPATSTCVTAN